MKKEWALKIQGRITQAYRNMIWNKNWMLLNRKQGNNRKLKAKLA